MILKIENILDLNSKILMNLLICIKKIFEIENFNQ